MDFFPYQKHIRILLSNPYLCGVCKERLLDLQEIIKKKEHKELSLWEDINRVLCRQWMGSPEKRDSPIYNLKKTYGYDLDHNSGFYKSTLERFRDNISNNIAEWTVGGIIAIALSLLGAYFTLLFGIKP